MSLRCTVFGIDVVIAKVEIVKNSGNDVGVFFFQVDAVLFLEVAFANSLKEMRLGGDDDLVNIEFTILAGDSEIRVCSSQEDFIQH